jgi:hypothetical protein
VISLVDLWRATTLCKVVPGSSILLWDDMWQDDILSVKSPRLHSFAKDRLIYAKEFLSLSVVHDAFCLPLSVEAYDKYNQLQDILIT